MEGAQLPRRFPLVLGKDLMLTASVRIEGSSVLFQLTEMSARALPRRGGAGRR